MQSYGSTSRRGRLGGRTREIDEAAEGIVYPHWSGEAAIPVGSGSREARGNIGVAGRQIGFFAGICVKIVELREISVGAEPFPFALAHSEGRTVVHPPKEPVVWSGFVFPIEKRNQVYAVERWERVGVFRAGGGKAVGSTSSAITGAS